MAFSLYVIAPDSFTYILSLSLSLSHFAFSMRHLCLHIVHDVQVVLPAQMCRKLCASSLAASYKCTRVRVLCAGTPRYTHTHEHTCVCKLGMHRLPSTEHRCTAPQSRSQVICVGRCVVVHALCPAAAVCVRVTVRTCRHLVRPHSTPDIFPVTQTHINVHQTQCALQFRLVTA